METTYYGNATGWYRGDPPGPWVMTDQENNLVGCVTNDGTKNCPDLRSISWRFVTAMAKGEPHHWTSMGGNAQKGSLAVMFDGPRVDVSYDPMRKQGAILLGNGGDNSNGSQGTFYEGAMTAAGTFPTDATDQLVQANVVAAKYDEARVTIAAATLAPSGLQTFSPGSSQDTAVTFTNTTSAPATGVTLSIVVPNARWTSVVPGTVKTSVTIAEPVAPGDSVNAVFKVTSGPAAFNGDLVGRVSWKNATSGAMASETTVEKVRSVSPVKINEFRVSAGAPTNFTNSFIELFNAGATDVDLSNWSLTSHATQQAIFSTVKIPAGAKLASHGFYLLGLSTSGLAAQARAGDAAIHVRSTTGLSVGDTIEVDSGSSMETRKIASIGTPAGNPTTLWQPLPEGPVITIPVGSTHVPVTSIGGFTVGDKIGIGYGATFPSVAKAMERYEVVTVTAVGKPGTQAFLGANADAGATNIKVTSVANISIGDTIRLDIDSVGHGIETVTVTRVGTQSGRTSLAAEAAAGATTIRVRAVNGFVVGDQMTVGTPATRETVTIAAVGAPGPGGAATVDFTPALGKTHVAREFVVAHGTGLDLAAPLKFNHSANLPFAVQGTGISFTPATAFAHASNEPIQPLGTGITLDSPLAKEHAIDAVVRDAAATAAGYQGDPAPNQWFGGPALSGGAGSIVLRDAAGLVVDSLNYGGLVDPWAAEGYQANSGAGESGCRAPSPGNGRAGGGAPGAPALSAPHRSAFRFPDGADTDSNCNDFFLQRASTLSAPATVGAANIKVNSVGEITAGQTLVIDSGANVETAIVETVGTAGATTTGAATNAGVTVIPVAGIVGFAAGQTITVDSGASVEEAVIVSVAGAGRGGPATITVTTALKSSHAAGVQVSGSGITLTTALTKAHTNGAQVAGSVPTPGAPNQLERVRK